MDTGHAVVAQSDTDTDAPSIGAAVGGASLVNVTYLTAGGASPAARGTVNPLFLLVKVHNRTRPGRVVWFHWVGR